MSNEEIFYLTVFEFFTIGKSVRSDRNKKQFLRIIKF